MSIAGALFVGLTGGFLARHRLLRFAGTYLVASDPLENADAIVVLAGNPILTAPEAATLFREGWAPRIILVSEVRPAGYDDLRQDGISVPRDHEVAISILEGYGVPKEHVRVLDEETAGTYPELRAVGRFLRRADLRRVIAVCLKNHSRRVRAILHDIMHPWGGFIVHPVPRDSYDPDQWWQDRLSFQRVLLEYAKLVNFWLWKDYWESWEQSPPPGVLVGTPERVAWPFRPGGNLLPPKRQRQCTSTAESDG